MPTAQQVHDWLDHVDYPCQKDDLVRHAEGRGAPADVLDALRALPLGEYASKADVTKGVDPG